MSSETSGFCTATLIGCETVLTAAHCVCPDGADTYADCVQAGVADPATIGFFFQHAGFVMGTRSIAIHPEFASDRAGDIAVIKLNQPLTGITPLGINTIRRPPPGTTGFIVGFGRTGDPGLVPPGVGIKRTGSVQTSRCPAAIPGDTHDCYEAAASDDPAACQGDSGGPLLVDFGMGPVVAAVASGGRGGLGVLNCQPPFVAYYTDVLRHRAFVEEQLGPDSADGPCGDLPPVGAPGTVVRTFRGDLTASDPEFRSSFEVPVGTDLLRVTMNGVLATDAGRNNFDLYVKPGSPPSTTDSECADTRDSAYGSCEVTSPAAGTWHALARHVAGHGELQLTATLFDDPNRQDSPSPTPTATREPTRGPTSTPRPPIEDCVGDCDHSGRITIAELIRGVAMALGNGLANQCADFDPEGDGVSIADLIKAVNGALYGCLPR